MNVYDFPTYFFDGSGGSGLYRSLFSITPKKSFCSAIYIDPPPLFWTPVTHFGKETGDEKTILEREERRSTWEDTERTESV